MSFAIGLEGCNAADALLLYRKDQRSIALSGTSCTSSKT